MKYILIIFISILLLTSTLFGQSSKPLGVVLPPIVKGNVSDTRKQFLLNTLYDELSKYFDFSFLPQIESGDCLVGCDVFQLQIVEEDENTQFSLRWMNENFRRIETKLCGGCKTIELNGKLKELVEKLVRGNNVETVVVVEKRRKGVLFHRLVSGEFRWFGNGDEEKDGKYVGDIENGEPIGQGTFTWSDGEKYAGEWRDGRKSGQGTLTLSSGNKYVGEFKDGIYHGQGTFTWSDGDKYVGEFKDGKKHGQGTYIKPAGRKYVGEWKDGLKKGLGTLTYGKGKWEGDKYVGEFKDGKKHGQGTYTFSDEKKYIGKWKNGKQNGQGTLTFGKGKWEGDKYVGEFKSNKYHGQGMYTYSNGDKYVGEHKDDKEHGQGTFTWSSGEQVCGWNSRMGKNMVKGHTLILKENKYVGEWTRMGQQNTVKELLLLEKSNGKETNMWGKLKMGEQISWSRNIHLF